MFDETPHAFIFSLPRATRLLPVALLLSTACVGEDLGPLDPDDATFELRSGGSDCGDGVLQPAEQCDDGNLADDDGCDATCTPSGVAAVSTGEAATCALTLAGNIKCWGRGDHGQLGRADTLTIGDDELPASVDFVDIGAAADGVYTNGIQTFAVLENGAVRAWGENTDYELGLPHTVRIGDDETPASALVTTTLSLGGPAASLAIGEGFGCALLTDGQVECWGRGDEGQLGHGDPAGLGMGAPSAGSVIVDLDGVAQQITAGSGHVCALLQDGAVHCWGLNDVGQLGHGHTGNIGDDETAADAGPVPLGTPATQVVAGANHTCALLDTGAVHCWGHNDRGQLGRGHTQTIGDDESPTTGGALALGGPVTQLVAAEQHTCARTDTGAVRCWGGNLDGRLGYGHADHIGDDETPASVAALDFGGSSVISVFGGSLSQHTCALLDTGALRCWGVDDRGQLGLGFTTPDGQLMAGPGTVPDVILIDDPDL